MLPGVLGEALSPRPMPGFAGASRPLANRARAFHGLLLRRTHA